MKYEIDLITESGDVTIKIGPGVYRNDTPETKTRKEHKPWLDWQENRPDNLPRKGKTVLMMVKNKYSITGYLTIANQWKAHNTKDEYDERFNYSFNFDDVTKWAYIPE